MTNAEAQFNKSLRPRKPEGSLGRTAQDVHLDSHTAPEPMQPIELLLMHGQNPIHALRTNLLLVVRVSRSQH